MGRNGSPLEWLYVTGPMLRARYFEASAVPELRLHTAALAARLANQLKDAAPKVALAVWSACSDLLPSERPLVGLGDALYGCD